MSRPRGLRTGAYGYPRGMEIAVLVLASVVALATAVGVLWLLVWGARKDGEHDRAVQKRLGIRRRTRIGL